jgi:hypothetical protein
MSFTSNFVSFSAATSGSSTIISYRHSTGLLKCLSIKPDPLLCSSFVEPTLAKPAFVEPTFFEPTFAKRPVAELAFTDTVARRTFPHDGGKAARAWNPTVKAWTKTSGPRRSSFQYFESLC